ncbi:MAG: VanZ family protein [Pseudomonadota bacterium]|nr:VanZ family protein [Pseudomonadota bacterium]
MVSAASSLAYLGMTLPQREPAPSSTPPAVAPSAAVFARVALLVYLLLILYASWYPFSGWTYKGVTPLAYLTAPLPHYWTVFDVVTNVLAYIPLGMLLVYALYPQVRGATALVVTVLGTLLWSGTMEAVQTFLPTRVASNLDLMTNVLGAAIGGVIGLASSAFFLQESQLIQLRQRWFSHEASRGLIVVGTWPLAQVYPQSYLFGHGQLMPIFSDWLADWIGVRLEPIALIWPGLELNPEQFWLAETLVSATGMCGAMLTLLCLLRKRAPTWVLLATLLALTIGIKLLATALLFAPENAMVWLTPGARGGLLLGALMVIGLRFLSPAVQRRLAVLMLLTSLIAVNLIPSNPYFVATLQRWVQGKFLSFDGAAQFLALIWPILALWFLLHPTHRRKRLH